MLRLKGQTEYGELVKFNISQVFDVCLRNNWWYVKGYPNDYIIDTATIQPADDPRKQMLENVRDRFLWLFGNNKTHSIISLVQVNSIIDEMEAKL